MTTITVQSTQQLAWADVEAECALGLTISDAAAVTIAAAWQSPGTTGAAFAQLASTGQVDSWALRDALNHACNELLTRPEGTGTDLAPLASLCAWAFDRSRTRN